MTSFISIVTHCFPTCAQGSSPVMRCNFMVAHQGTGHLLRCLMDLAASRVSVRGVLLCLLYSHSDSHLFFCAADSHSSEAPPEGEEIFCWAQTVPSVTLSIGTSPCLLHSTLLVPASDKHLEVLYITCYKVCSVVGKGLSPVVLGEFSPQRLTAWQIVPSLCANLGLNGLG